MDELRIVMPDRVDSILAAVSGGADSVALLALLREEARKRKIALTAAHFEHGIRAEASLADAAFVRTLCGEWGIPLFEESADVPALARVRSIGLEEAAREARYAFLRRAKEQAGAQLIALAHHRDDQAETVLMHLMRGSGLKGVSGMRELEGDLYRPLLKFPKETLISWLRSSGIPWREDETNAIPDTPRNGLRLCVIPEAERFYPGMRAAVSRFSAIAAVENDYMECETDRILKGKAVQLPGGWLIRLDQHEMVHRAILMRMIHRLTGTSSEAVERAVNLVGMPGGVSDMESGWRAEKGRMGLYLLKEPYNKKEERPLPPEGVVDLQELGMLSVMEGTGVPVKGERYIQELDGAALEGAVVRTRRAGDFIHPLGAGGRQKLSDYFINRHVDRPIRDMVPLIARGSEVLWVMGEGISEKVRLGCGSRAVRLELTGWPLQKDGGKRNA